METIFPVKFKGKLNIDQIERFVDVCMEFAAEIKVDVTFVRGRKEREGCSNCNLPHVSGSLPSDTQMIDFLEQLMTDDSNYCEVYLAGLRDFTGKAKAFQFETNPLKIETLNKPTLREAIAKAMELVGNDH